MTSAEQAVYRPPRTTPAPGIRRPLPALVAAVGVVVAYLGLAFIQVLASVIYDWASGRFEDDILGLVPSSFIALQQDVPVSIVVLVVTFLMFWGALPIHAGLRLGGAVARGVVAGIAAGVVMGFVVGIQYLVIIRNLSYSAGDSPGAGSILRSLAEAADNSVTSFVQTAPLVLLGALILWNWLGSHPRAPRPGSAGDSAPAFV